MFNPATFFLSCFLNYGDIFFMAYLIVKHPLRIGLDGNFQASYDLMRIIKDSKDCFN
jgi:hypothetical protein